MAEIKAFTPEPRLSYAAQLQADSALLRALMELLLEQNLISPAQMDSVYGDAIRRCQSAADADAGDPEGADVAAGDAAALLALVRTDFRRAFGL